VVDIGTFSELPDDCGVKLPWGSDFANTLGAALRTLLADEHRREQIGQNARQWINRIHAIEDTTAAYAEEIGALKPNDRSPLVAATPGLAAYSYPTATTLEGWLVEHSEKLQAIGRQLECALWWREGLLPLADGGVRLHLAVADSVREPVSWVLQNLYGYQSSELAAASRCSHRLMMTSLATLAQDPVAQLGQAALEMPLGSELILCITRLDQSPPLLQRPSSWVLALECAGFKLISQHEAPRDISFTGWRQPAPEITLRARRISAQVERYPATLYDGQSNRWMLAHALGEPGNVSDSAPRSPAA